MFQERFKFAISYVSTMSCWLTLVVLCGLLSSSVSVSYSNLGLTEVPTDLENIFTIELENNLISTIGDGLFGDQVNIVKLNMNRLTSISANAFCGTQLYMLQLEKNSLTSIPDLTCVKSTIEQVAMSWNLLSGHIGGGTLSNCPNLWKLRLLHNFISSIDADAFCGTALKLFSAQNNSLTEVPDLSCVGSTLETFNLFDNKICSLKQNDFTAFEVLKQIGFSGNCLTALDHITEATNLWPTLEVLKVANLGLLEVNFTAGSFSILDKLEIEKNEFTCFRMVSKETMFPSSLVTAFSLVMSVLFIAYNLGENHQFTNIIRRTQMDCK